MYHSIALIILNWNNLSDLIECLTSIRELVVSYKIIPIIIDQGSTDGSVEEVKRNFKNFILIENLDNVGACEGYNIGYRKAFEIDVDYIFVQDNDTVLDNNIFDLLIPELESDSSVGIVGPAMLQYDQKDIIWNNGNFINLKNMCVSGHETKGKIYREICKDNVECDFIPACGLLLKTDVAKKIGEWDKDFFLYHNDVEYCLRAKKMGYRVLSVPKAKMWHKVSSTVKPYSPMMIYYKGRNKILLLRKYGSKTSIEQFFLSHIFKAMKILNEKNWDINSIRPLLRAIFHGLTNRSGKRDFL